MAGLGIERLQEIIRAKVATMMIRDISDPRLGMVTITKVRLSRDLETCVVSWSTLAEGPARKRTEAALESARGYVRREVASLLRTRKSPRIDFAFDPSIEGAARLSDLIDRTTKEDAERRRAREGGGDVEPPKAP